MKGDPATGNNEQPEPKARERGARIEEKGLRNEDSIIHYSLFIIH